MTFSTASAEPINVVVPIGGNGTRFSTQGYRYPKPLINIVGRPMLLRLIDHLSLRPCDTLWIAINEEIEDNFQIGQLVNKSFPKIDARVLRLRHQTKGASETLYIVTQSMSKEQLSRRTVSLDCDTIYWTDILQSVRDMPAQHGGCVYFIDNGNRPIFSYIKTEIEGSLEKIVEVREKVAISNQANTGAYIFPSASQLKYWAADYLDTAQSEFSDIGEYFTSRLVGLMIENGIPYLGLPIDKDDFSIVGTPEQLREFLRSVKLGRLGCDVQMKTRRFCFDLDMTLVGVPKTPGDYATCPPIEHNIKLVQQLYNAGHYIIIQTARRMRTHNGNVGAVLADVGTTTFQQLTQYNIPFHDIHFGKPYADVYIDDLAVNANLDTMQEVGWLLDESPASHNDSAEDPKKAGMVAARDFNTIQIINDKVIKSSKSDNILGEVFFYSHMPQGIAHIFPSIYSVDYIKETSTYTIGMENRRGLTFSHLLAGRSITKGRLYQFLRTLHQIHSVETPGQATLPIPPALQERFDQHSIEKWPQGGSVYENYGTKLRRRYEQHKKLYDAMGPIASSLFSRIDEFLDTYEAEKRAVQSSVIHGDPVFSNAILSPDGKAVSFIDVRCQLGNVLTSAGDINYDLAKVLQSLCGYDHVLFLSAQVNTNMADLADGKTPVLEPVDAELLENLRESFFEFIEQTYPIRLHRKTLFRITASLFFSLIPLHRPELGKVFLRLCQETLDKASAGHDGVVY